MDFRHLSSFAAVATAGSFALAAKRLRLAQPALSRQIRALEEKVEASLFERLPRGIRLTSAGEALLESVPPIGDAIRRMLDHTRLARDGQWGKLRVGLARAALESTAVARAITLLTESYPGIEVAVIDLAPFTHWRMLRQGELDLAVATNADVDDQDIRREVLLHNAIDSAIVPSGHPSAHATKVSVGELRDLPLVTLSHAREHGFGHVHDQLRALAPLEEHDSVESVFSRVAAGRGWTVGPSFFARNPPAGTAVVPLNDVNIRMDVSLYWRARDDSELLANALRAFRSAARAPRNGQAPVGSKRAAVAERPKKQTTSHQFPGEIQRAWLHTFLATVEAGSFSGAATQLALTQSAISRQMQELEEHVGCVLLERDTHGVALTRAGEVFATEARAVVALTSDAMKRARDAADGNSGRCVAGVLPSDLTGVVVALGIELLAERFPAATLELHEMRSPAQLAALERGEIDVAIAGVFATMHLHGFESFELRSDAFDCALVAPTHPLAARPALRAADLRDEPFLYAARSVGPSYFDAIMTALEGIGLQPRIGPTFDGARAMWKLASEGAGWLIGLHSQRGAPPPGLHAVPIEGLHLPWSLRLLWRRGDERESVRNVVAAFRDAATRI